MAEAAFGTTYNGPALADGRMPVRDLAPALLALGDVFAEASVAMYPDREPVALKIKATAEGSFELQLVLEVSGVWDQVVDLLSSDAASALANLIEIVAGGAGLFAVIRAIRRRAIRRRDEIEPGRLRLTLEDGDTIEVSTEVFDLFTNAQARKQTRQVVEPLGRPGVERLDFTREDETTVSIEAADVPAYDLPEEMDVPLLERESEMVLAIASVAFIQDNKWRLSDGERTFYAMIEDQAFLDRVEKGLESFRKGDFLRCRIRVVQSQRRDALHTDYYVTEVIQHIPRAIQILFPDAGDGEPPGELPPS